MFIHGQTNYIDFHWRLDRRISTIGRVHSVIPAAAAAELEADTMDFRSQNLNLKVFAWSEQLRFHLETWCNYWMCLFLM